MSKQIVISGNRILAYGENCFIAMGGTVICPTTGRVYQNATVATVDALPADVDEVGYEYHAGDFVPCAPFGKGAGNIAVFCNDDCKSLKDSGFSIDSDFIQCAITTHTGTGTSSANNPTKITFDFVPIIVFFIPHSNTPANVPGPWGGYAVNGYAELNVNDTSGGVLRPVSTVEGNTISIYYPGSAEAQFNTLRAVYSVVAFGKRSV